MKAIPTSGGKFKLSAEKAVSNPFFPNRPRHVPEAVHEWLGARGFRPSTSPEPVTKASQYVGVKPNTPVPEGLEAHLVKHGYSQNLFTEGQYNHNSHTAHVREHSVTFIPIKKPARRR